MAFRRKLNPEERLKEADELLKKAGDLLELGFSFEAKREHKRALECYEKALECDPKSLDACKGAARMCDALGKPGGKYVGRMYALGYRMPDSRSLEKKSPPRE